MTHHAVGDSTRSYGCGSSGSSGLPLSIKLCGREGYAVWKFKMKNYLIHEDLWETIIGYPEGNTIEVYVKYRNDQKALSKICLTLDGPAITHVRSATTAKDAWDALRLAYEDRGMGRRLALERKLYRLNLSDFSDMESYINAVLSTAQDLGDIGKSIDDASIAAILLGGLTTKYEPLIMGLENSNIDITSELVKSKLLNEISREIEPESALRTNINRNKFKKKKIIICYDCKEIGHKRPDCPRRKEKLKTNKNFNGSATLTAQALSGHGELQQDKWIIDSGATTHMSSRLDWMSSMNPQYFGKVTIANGEVINCSGVGNVSINTQNNVVNQISDVAYVPKLKMNLLSIKKVVDKGITVIFDANGCNFYNSHELSVTGDPIVHGSVDGGLYTLDCTINKPESCSYTVSSNSTTSANTQYQLWHKRLGHLCRFAMQSLKGQALIDFNKADKEPCISCIEAKQSRKTFKKVSYSRASEPLELIHSDLCGPMSEVSWQGNKYALLFIDDFTRMIFVYFLSSKTEVKNKFVVFQALVERKMGARIKVLRTDNGTEYLNREMTDYLSSQGIEHQTTAPYSPQSNGVAERTNRSIVEKCRSLLADSSLSKAYWQDACNTAVYLKNRCPHRALNCKTPFEKWYGFKPDLNHLRVFGCRAMVHIPSCSRKKLDIKAEELIFIGYTEDKNTYYFRNPRYPRKLVKSRDVTFLENCFTNIRENKINSDISTNNLVPFIHITENNPSIQENVTENERLEEILVESPENVLQVEVGTPENVSTQSPEFLTQDTMYEPRYPSRVRKPPDFLTYEACHSFQEVDEPQSYLEAMKSSDSRQWKLAMEDEFNSLIKKHTWNLVERPNRRVIPCKWVFKCKRNAEGVVVKYKARLVAKGFNQVCGIDYNETFSPVVRNSSLRTLLALVAEKNLNMHHLDIDTAFLNGDLEEEVYMQQPEGFAEQGAEEKVCLLKRSIYGLKQAARAWNIKLNETLSIIGFKQTSSEPCVYLKKFGSESVILAVYVDDIMIFYENKMSLEIVKKDLQKYFSLKDLGPLNFCLGLNIESDENKNIFVSQKTYIKLVLERFGMKDCKEVTTPLQNNKLKKGEQQCNYPYQNLIGCLMYIAVNTRPDIAYATSYLSQFNNCFDKSHWLAAKRVLQYLKGTINYCIAYRKTGKVLCGYADADWANCELDRRSYTGYCFMLANSPISWECKKQQTVALSSTEAEYMALCSAAKEAVFLRRLISEITGDINIVTVFSDSQSAQKIACAPIHHNRTKHIDTKYHFIREKIIEGIISVKYIPTDEMPADVLTKPLGCVAHRRCSTILGFSTN